MQFTTDGHWKEGQAAPRHQDDQQSWRCDVEEVRYEIGEEGLMLKAQGTAEGYHCLTPQN
jgi:hypothetical protein